MRPGCFLGCSSCCPDVEADGKEMSTSWSSGAPRSLDGDGVIENGARGSSWSKPK